MIIGKKIKNQYLVEIENEKKNLPKPYKNIIMIAALIERTPWGNIFWNYSIPENRSKKFIVIMLQS